MKGRIKYRAKMRRKSILTAALVAVFAKCGIALYEKIPALEGRGLQG